MRREGRRAEDSRWRDYCLMNLPSITMRISSPLGGRKAEVGALDRAGGRKLTILLPRRPLSTYAFVPNAMQPGVILTNQSRMPYWMHEPS